MEPLQSLTMMGTVFILLLTKTIITRGIQTVMATNPHQLIMIGLEYTMIPEQLPILIIVLGIAFCTIAIKIILKIFIGFIFNEASIFISIIYLHNLSI